MSLKVKQIRVGPTFISSTKDVIIIIINSYCRLMKFINVIVKFSAMKHTYQWLILKLAMYKSSH